MVELKLRDRMPFGKYKGEKIYAILGIKMKGIPIKHEYGHGVDYLNWFHKNVKDVKLHKDVLFKMKKIEQKVARESADYSEPYYHYGDYGQSSCPGDYMGMCPEDYGIFPWGHS